MKRSILIFGIICSFCVTGGYAADIISPETVDAMVVRAARVSPKVNPVKDVSVVQSEQNINNMDMLGQNGTECAGLRCRDKDCTVVHDSAGCVCKDKRGIECPMGTPVSVAGVATDIGEDVTGVYVDEIDQENIDMLPWRDLNKKYCPKGCHVLREDGALVIPIHCVDRHGNDCGRLDQPASASSNNRAAVTMPMVEKTVSYEKTVEENSGL